MLNVWFWKAFRFFFRRPSLEARFSFLSFKGPQSCFTRTMTLMTRGEYSLSAGMSAKNLPYLNDLVKRIYHSYIKKSSNFNSNNNKFIEWAPLIHILLFWLFSTIGIAHKYFNTCHSNGTERQRYRFKGHLLLFPNIKDLFLIRGF